MVSIEIFCENIPFTILNLLIFNFYLAFREWDLYNTIDTPHYLTGIATSAFSTIYVNINIFIIKFIYF